MRWVEALREGAGQGTTQPPRTACQRSVGDPDADVDVDHQRHQLRPARHITIEEHLGHAEALGHALHRHRAEALGLRELDADPRGRVERQRGSRPTLGAVSSGPTTARSASFLGSPIHLASLVANGAPNVANNNCVRGTQFESGGFWPERKERSVDSFALPHSRDWAFRPGLMLYLRRSLSARLPAQRDRSSSRAGAVMPRSRSITPSDRGRHQAVRTRPWL